MIEILVVQEMWSIHYSDRIVKRVEWERANRGFPSTHQAPAQRFTINYSWALHTDSVNITCTSRNYKPSVLSLISALCTLNAPIAWGYTFEVRLAHVGSAKGLGCSFVLILSHIKDANVLKIDFIDQSVYQSLVMVLSLYPSHARYILYVTLHSHVISLFLFLSP